MGEVEEKLETGMIRPSESMRDNRLARWLMPNFMNELSQLEDQLFTKANESVTQMNLQLQRVQQQNRSLMNEDVGQYKNRWTNLASGDYNPDTISFSEYKKMYAYDAQVIAGFDLIQMGVLLKPWRIKHKNQDIVNELTKAFMRMRYPSFREAMKAMMSAILYGNSTTEVVFDEYKDHWYPRQKNGLKTFDPETIRFYSDEHGNLDRVQQRTFISTPENISSWWGTGIDLPVERTLIWSHEKQFGNWYGNAMLKGCYKNWYIKDAMLKFANIAYERFGSPIFMGVAQNVSDMQTISTAIEHLYARSQAVIVKRDDKDPTDVQVLESRRREMPFNLYIKYHDEMILRRMLVGTPLFEGGGGTYGSKVPLDIVFMRFEDFRLELIDVVNDLIRMIVDLNWAVDEYPQFEFAPLTTLDQQQMRTSIYDAIDRKIVFKDEPWIREELGFPVYRQAPTDGYPKPDEDEEEDEDEVVKRPPRDTLPITKKAQDLDALLEKEYHKMMKEYRDSNIEYPRRDDDDEEDDE